MKRHSGLTSLGAERGASSRLSVGFDEGTADLHLHFCKVPEAHKELLSALSCLSLSHIPELPCASVSVSVQ